MATAKKALSIQQYASIFAGLTVALLITFGALTYHEMQQVRSNLTESSLIAARKELVTNVSKAYSSARSTAASFAQWNEVLRQIQSPRNHETWRQHRLEHTDTLPKHVIDVDIYDTSGTVLVPAGKQTLPSSINTLNRNPTVEVYDRTPTLIVTHPVFSTHEQAKLLGYVAIRMQLLPLLTTQPYRFIESSSLAIGQPQEPHLRPRRVQQEARSCRPYL